MGNYLALTGIIAGESLTAKQYLAVKLSTSADRQVLAITNANAERPVGILQNDPASGEAADVAVTGVCKAIYGGTVTRGDKLGCNNTGQLITDVEVIAQTGVDLHHIAIALESGSLNDVRQVYCFAPQIVGLE